MGRYWPAGVQFAGSPVNYGVFRTLRAVRGDARGDSPRDEQLAVAGVYVRVHDSARVRGRTHYLSSWHSNDQLSMQDILAILIVLAAAAFLSRRMWQALTRRRSGACGACSNCPSNSASKTPSLVTLSPNLSHAKPQRREEFGG